MFVGRQTELQAALTELERARDSNRPVTVFVRGEAGIGKTVLVGAVIESARADSSHALIGRADALDRGVPFAVFSDAMSRMSTEDLTPAEIDALGEVRASLDLRTLSDAQESRLERVLGSLASLLTLLGERAPVVVALEDLHFADPDSIAVYGLLARQLSGVPVLFAMTARPGYEGPVADLESFVARLVTDGRATLLDLGPLSPAMIGLLLNSILGRRSTPELTAQVVERTHGNPFFALELGKQLDNAGFTGELRPDVRIGFDQHSGNTTDRALLGHFFAHDPEVARAARPISIFARFSPAHLPFVSDLTGLSHSELVRLFDQMVTTRLLVRTSDGGYEFSQSLLAEALYRDLGIAERRNMHRAAADLLRAERERGVQVDLFDLATHITRSVAPGDPLAVEAALDAADLAFGNAPLVAAGWYAQALTCMVPTDPRRGSAFVQQLRGVLVGSRTDQATVLGRQGLIDFADDAVRPEIADVLCHALFAAGELTEAVAVADAELARSPGFWRLCALRACILGQLGRLDEADLEYARAWPLLPDPPAALAALPRSELLVHAAMTGRRRDIEQLRSAMTSDLQQLPSSVRADFTQLLLTVTLQSGGKLDDAERAFEAVSEGRSGSTTTNYGGSAELNRALIDWLRGRWPQAIERAKIAIAALDSNGSHTVLAGLRGVVTLMLSDRGDQHDAMAMVQGLRPGTSSTRAYVAVARARVAAARGEVASACALLEEQHREAIEFGNVIMSSLVTEEWAQLEWTAGHVDRAADIAEQGRARIAYLEWAMLDIFSLRSVAMTTRDTAAGLRAAELASGEGVPVELAKCRLVLGELDVEAETNLRAAYEAFAAVGASPWRRRTLAALRERHISVPRGAAGTSPLTPVEIELARLVSRGMTNRQIATALNYSAKTVEVYLSRLYAKTGQAGRVELSRAVYSGELFETS